MFLTDLHHIFTIDGDDQSDIRFSIAQWTFSGNQFKYTRPGGLHVGSDASKNNLNEVRRACDQFFV